MRKERQKMGLHRSAIPEPVLDVPGMTEFNLGGG